MRGARPSDRRRGRRGRVGFGVAALVLASGGGAARARAQLPDFPTLAGSGVEYISESGYLQITLSGRLDLEGIHVGDSWVGLIDRGDGDAPLPAAQEACTECHVGMAYQGGGGEIGAHRLRLLADVFLGDHVYSLLEVRSDRGHAPSDGSAEARVEQALLRLSTDGGLGVQVGRFANPFGSYVGRHLGTDDWFLRPPLAYDYRTVMSRTLLPSDASVFLDWKHAPAFLRKPGTPPVWDVPYQWGAMAFGRVGPLDLGLAAMSSAPSSAPAAWGLDGDPFDRVSWVATARTRLSPSLSVGASYDRGPWMEKTIAGAFHAPSAAPSSPAGWRDFDQELVEVDATFARGSSTILIEAMLDRWEVPNVGGRPTERSYSAEIQTDVVAGLFYALRVGYIDFRPVSDGLGAASPLALGRTDWDFDVLRYEGSIGYRLARNVGVLLSGFRQVQLGGADGDTSFAGVRLWWGF